MRANDSRHTGTHCHQHGQAIITTSPPAGNTIDLTVTVADNDPVGLTLSPTTLTLGEGATTTYTAVLDTLPS